MNRLRINIGEYTFSGRLEDALAPKTCAMFRSLLPIKSYMLHVRWSGEGVWIPYGERDFGVPYENATSHPLPGQFILHPGGISESEILLAYGSVDFSSKVGQLAGNHFLTLIDNLHTLPELGNLVLWKGSQDIEISIAD
jgi:hypothetical protein